MSTYTHSQLEQLWIQAGGPPAQADTAAAIAQAESGGRADVVNSIGATGLWQIYGNPFPGNAQDPLTNAKMAVAKYKAASGFTPWTTYTGADTGPGGTRGPKTYLQYLTGKASSAPATSSPGTQQTVDSTKGNTLFAKEQGGLKYAFVWVVLVVGGLVLAGVGLNSALGKAPSNAIRRGTQNAGQAAQLAAMA